MKSAVLIICSALIAGSIVRSGQMISAAIKDHAAANRYQYGETINATGTDAVVTRYSAIDRHTGILHGMVHITPKSTSSTTNEHVIRYTRDIIQQPGRP